MSKNYHLVFLSICAISFAFSIAVGGFGIYFILKNPDKEIALVVIEAVSALGFFYSKWSQQTFLRLYREAAYDDMISRMMENDHAKNSQDIFKELMAKVVDSRGDIIKNAEDIKNVL